MSTDDSYYDIHRVSSSCEPNQEDDALAYTLDSTFYDHTLPVSNSFEVAYGNQYVATDTSGINDFNDLSTYYPSSPGPEHDYASPPPISLHESHSPALQPAIQLEASIQRGQPIPIRPRSSPSTFGPEVAWSPESVQSLHSVHSVHSVPSGHSIPPTTGTDHRALTPEQAYQLTPAPTPRHRQAASLSSLAEFQHAEVQQTPPRRYYAPIAPHPVGMRQLQGAKHSLSDDDWESPPTKRARRSAPPSPNIDMNEEDSFLLRLKDEEGLTWKEIQNRFQDEMGKSFQVPALQMRLKRLRERMRIWTEGDIQALRLSHEYWMQQKFEIISAKMTEFGATEKWSPKQCSKKWQELSWTPEYYSHPMLRTPTFSTSYTASPIEGPGAGFYLAHTVTSS